MEFLDTLLPEFGSFWVEQCMELVGVNGGVPPHIATPVYHDQTLYACPGTIAGRENVTALNFYLQAHGSDLASRFVVLRYLWPASVANAPPDSILDHSNELLDGGTEAAQEAADHELRSAVRPLLTDFVARLPPNCIASPEQALWEFKQAVILSRPDRLKALAQRYREITAQPADQSNLMLARALWLLSGQFWAHFIYEIVSGRRDLPWEAFIEEGHSGSPLFPVVPPKSGHTTADTHLVFDVIACLQKADQEILGPHWAVLADCWLLAGLPAECAKIWEQRGLEILASAAEANGLRADQVLLLPDYRLRIADLWAESGRIDKEIEVLESLRERCPRLAGVNRILAECYLRMNPPDLERATQRMRDEAGCDEAFSQDSVVRLFLHQYQRSWEVERQVNEEREKHEGSPASLGQRTAIRDVLRLAWSQFDRLSHDVQEDWITGLSWCYGDHPQFDETERGEYAVTRCIRALETHLREALFEPLKLVATRSEIGQLRDTDRELKSYLQGAYRTGADAGDDCAC